MRSKSGVGGPRCGVAWFRGSPPAPRVQSRSRRCSPSPSPQSSAGSEKMHGRAGSSVPAWGGRWTSCRGGGAAATLSAVITQKCRPGTRRQGLGRAYKAVRRGRRVRWEVRVSRPDSAPNSPNSREAEGGFERGGSMHLARGAHLKLPE